MLSVADTGSACADQNYIVHAGDCRQIPGISNTCNSLIFILTVSFAAASEIASKVKTCIMHAEDCRLILGIPATPRVQVQREKSGSGSGVQTSGAGKKGEREQKNSKIAESVEDLEALLSSLVEYVNTRPGAREIVQ